MSDERGRTRDAGRGVEAGGSKTPILRIAFRGSVASRVRPAAAARGVPSAAIGRTYPRDRAAATAGLAAVCIACEERGKGRRQTCASTRGGRRRRGWSGARRARNLVALGESR